MYVKKPVNSAAPSNNKIWTAEEDAILRKMAEEKSTTAKIAKALGRTKASIWGRKSILGIKTRLLSSKGHNISVPTTLSTKNRGAKSKVNSSPKNVVKVSPQSNKSQAAVEKSYQGMCYEFDMLSKLAKQTGAKIVVTFE